jgi:hypothetical protein
MSHRTRRLSMLALVVFCCLGGVLMPASSWAIKGFRGDVLAFVDTEVTNISIFNESYNIRLELAVTLELEDNDPTPPHVIARLEVTAPNGVVYDMLNASFNNVEFFPPDTIVMLVPLFDANGDNLPDIPTGDYDFVLETGGKTFRATKAIQNVARLETPIRRLPAGNAQVTTTTPLFRWFPVYGAVAYRVRIHRLRQNFVDPARLVTEPQSVIEDAALFTSPYLANTSFTLPPGVLSPGRVYFWDVEALDARTLGQADNRTRRNGQSGSDVLARFFLAGPYAEIRAASLSIDRGERQRATIRIANTANTGVKVIVQAWLGLPSGKVQPLKLAGVTGPRTLRGNRVSDLEIYNESFTNADPVGTYAIGVRLLDPVTGDHLGNETIQRFEYTGR